MGDGQTQVGDAGLEVVLEAGHRASVPPDLRAQRDALWAWLIELKPEIGKIARFRRAGLNRLEIARALGWGEKRVRLAERKLADARLLPVRDSAQLSLLEG